MKAEVLNLLGESPVALGQHVKQTSLERCGAAPHCDTFSKSKSKLLQSF